MATLIIPCAGRSSRFPNMRPKWMLSHPDGKLMVQKAIEGLPLDKFDRIIITIAKKHEEDFNAKLWLEQAFEPKKNKKFEILVLDDFTSSQADTVYQTLIKKKVKGSFVVKDSDNHVRITRMPHTEFIVGLDIQNTDQEITRLKAKSFLVVNEQGIIIDIIEKRIRSEVVCVGVYGFASSEKFNDAFRFLFENQKTKAEIYLSHVISYLIGTGSATYTFVETTEFEDWGTLPDWRATQQKHSTYFIDIDGIVLDNRGKYGKENWGNYFKPIEENVLVIKKLYDEGAQIVFTTTRTDEYLGAFKKLLAKYGIEAHAFVTGCNHAPRMLINDFAPSNPYPVAQALNLPRNGLLKDFIE